MWREDKSVQVSRAPSATTDASARAHVSNSFHISFGGDRKCRKNMGAACIRGLRQDGFSAAGKQKTKSRRKERRGVSACDILRGTAACRLFPASGFSSARLGPIWTEFGPTTTFWLILLNCCFVSLLCGRDTTNRTQAPQGHMMH